MKHHLEDPGLHVFVLFFPIGSMGLVYLHVVDFYGKIVGK